MKVLFLNAGNETGGGMVHILQMLQSLQQKGEGTFVLAVLEEGLLKERAEALGIETVCFSEMSFPFLHELQFYIEQENFTHIHTHGPRANVLIAFLRRRLRPEFEWVTTVHSNPLVDFAHKGLRGKLLSKLHISALKKADKMITVCEAFQPVLKRTGVKKPLMTTIRNGAQFTTKMDEEAIVNDKRRALGLADEHIVFVQIARLEAVKAHEKGLYAFRNIVDKFPFARLLFVGAGPLEGELKQLTEKLNLEDYVTFLGERDDVADLLKLSHVSLLTSISEGFPYVLLESAQAKKPVIATDVGDVRHLVHQDSVGWLVEAGSEIGVVEAMEAAIESKQDGSLEKKGEALYEHAKKEFSVKTQTEKLLEVYREKI